MMWIAIFRCFKKFKNVNNLSNEMHFPNLSCIMPLLRLCANKKQPINQLTNILFTACVCSKPNVVNFEKKIFFEDKLTFLRIKILSCLKKKKKIETNKNYHFKVQ